MVICFVSYWGLNDGLTAATVLPHIKILSEFEKVKAINLITIERGPKWDETLIQIPKTQHHPIVSSTSVFQKAKDRSEVSHLIKQLHHQTPIDLIVARTSLAGWLIQSQAIRLKIPFTVESFEPHADYMADDGIWKRYGLKYRIARASEKKQLKQAQYILPVSEAYTMRLKHEHPEIAEKILTMPCCVDNTTFAYNSANRAYIRAKLGWDEQNIVGIYTGKLGGIYLDTEVVDLVKSCMAYFGDSFRLIVLSPEHKMWSALLVDAGISSSLIHLDLVAMQEVPKYLSAADFAFSLHRPTPSKIGITPIKNAEYLASGLPIISTPDIGDDSAQIEANSFGVLLNHALVLTQAKLDSLRALINESRPNQRYENWVKTNRSFDMVRNNYYQILNSKL